MNCRFFLLWLLCMIHTLIEKHEIFNSLFNVIAIASCNKEFANQIKHDFDTDVNLSENIPPNVKKEIKSVKFRRNKRKPKAKSKFNEGLFMRKHKKESFKKGSSKHSSTPEQLRMSSNRVDTTKHNMVSFSQNINMTSKEIETKDRFQSFIPRKKKRDSSKLCIVENVFSEESPYKQKHPKEESKGECSIDLSYEEKPKKAKDKKLAMFKLNLD